MRIFAKYQQQHLNIFFNLLFFISWYMIRKITTALKYQLSDFYSDFLHLNK